MFPFASGFSNDLSREAFSYRPPRSSLSITQILRLCDLVGYKMGPNKDRQDFSKYFYHSDKVHGLGNGLDIVWHVRAVGSVCLNYYPTLQPGSTRGPNKAVIEEMLTRLALFLPDLGYKDKYTVCLEEEFVIIPEEHRYISTGVYIMKATDFQEKYKDLYHFLQEKMEPKDK